MWHAVTCPAAESRGNHPPNPPYPLLTNRRSYTSLNKAIEPDLNQTIHFKISCGNMETSFTGNEKAAILSNVKNEKMRRKEGIDVIALGP